MKHLCKMCKKEMDERIYSSNKLYCKGCTEAIKQGGCWRYRIPHPSGNDVWVWVKVGATVRRAVVDGKNVEPVREVMEVVE